MRKNVLLIGLALLVMGGIADPAEQLLPDRPPVPRQPQDRSRGHRPQ